MQRRESRVLDTARNVQVFLAENADAVGPSIASCRRNLDDAIGQLTTMSVGQSAGQLVSKGATARRKSLVKTLKKHHMRPITLVAKQRLSAVPEFEALSMPTRNLGATQLVAAALAMATAAQPHEAVFTDVGLPDDFVAQLNAAANAVTASQAVRQASKVDTVSATAGIREQEKRLRGLFPLIDAIVGPKLGTNAVLLKKWDSTKAVGRKATAVPAQSPDGEGLTIVQAAIAAPAA